MFSSSSSTTTSRRRWGVVSAADKPRAVRNTLIRPPPPLSGSSHTNNAGGGPGLGISPAVQWAVVFLAGIFVFGTLYQNYNGFRCDCTSDSTALQRIGQRGKTGASDDNTDPTLLALLKHDEENNKKNHNPFQQGERLPIPDGMQAIEGPPPPGSAYNNTIPTFVVVCGKGQDDAVMETVTLLKSVISLASAPIRFVFFTDAEGSGRLHTLFAAIKNNLVYSVEIILVNLEDVKRWTEKISLSLTPKLSIHGGGHDHHKSSAWIAIKLLIPWLVPQHDHLVVLDADMFFIASPHRLWAEFDREPNGGWLYKMAMDIAEDGAAGGGIEALTEPDALSTGVVLIKCKRVREQGIYPTLMQKTLSLQTSWKDPHSRGGTMLYRPPPPTGPDQGVYYAMAKADASLFAPLNNLWMSEKHKYYGQAVKKGGQAGILHQSRHTKSAFAQVFTDMYDSYRWSWLHNPDHTKRIKMMSGYAVMPDDEL